MNRILTFMLSSKGVQQDLALFILRLTLGGFMVYAHGTRKLMKLMNGNYDFADPIGLGPEISLWLTAFAEVGCSILVVAGFYTRFALIPLIICMAVIAFVVHGPDPFGEKESALIYMAGYIALFLTGPGKWRIGKG